MGCFMANVCMCYMGSALIKPAINCSFASNFNANGSIKINNKEGKSQPGGRQSKMSPCAYNYYLYTVVPAMR
jgi:hypothetical protein